MTPLDTAGSDEQFLFSSDFSKETQSFRAG